MKNFHLLSTKELNPVQKRRLIEWGCNLTTYNFIRIERLTIERTTLYENLIFTSQNGVNCFLEQYPIKTELMQKKVFCVGEKTTETGFTVKKIEGDSQSVTVEGFVKKGIIPMPVTKVFSVGDTFTADGMFSVSSDGSPVLGGSVEITEIINCKSKTDLEAVLNKFSAFDTIFEKKIKYAESSDPNTSEYDPYGFTPAGAQAADNLMKAESYEDFFGEEYQAFMAEYAMSIMPPHYHYEANV